MKESIADQLTARAWDSGAQMGEAAARDIAAAIRALCAEKAQVNIIFSAASSQREIWNALRADETIEWGRVNAFCLSEFLGCGPQSPHSLSRLLKDAFFDHVPLNSVHLIDGSGDPQTECMCISALLNAFPADIALLSLGENGSLAFNEAPAADFRDPALVKPVSLSPLLLLQAVHEGNFLSQGDVPRRALTLTLPAIARARYHFCAATSFIKAQAVKNTLCAPVSAACPATLLRTLPGAMLYLERDSAVLL